MGDAVTTEAVGDVMLLLGIGLVGCLVVLLALAGLLVFLLARYQRQATFPMELLLRQDLPPDERIRSAFGDGVASGRIQGLSSPPYSHVAEGAGEGPNAPGPRLTTTSRAMAEAANDFDEIDPLNLG